MDGMKKPGAAKAEHRVCVLSLAEFIKRSQAGTNQRWVRSIASGPCCRSTQLIYHIYHLRRALPLAIASRKMTQMPAGPPASSDTCTTLEAARLLGLAVRSVQLMVDRGELEAWKTPGGHRRILRSSVREWMARRQAESGTAPVVNDRLARPANAAPTVLLIEDSVYYQNMVRLLLEQKFPGLQLHVAGEGIGGLAMAGRLQPDVLIVDILLPGIDGAALLTSLRSHAQFRNSRLVVVTSLDEAQREPYAYALAGVPVIHKSRLAADLPPQLADLLAQGAASGAA
jgi:excisionase family DNA binding protein